MQDGLRCPVCGGIDWITDGLAVIEGRDGTLSVEGVEAGPARRIDTWDCLRCGYGAEQSSGPARLLARAVFASRFGHLA